MIGKSTDQSTDYRCQPGSDHDDHVPEVHGDRASRADSDSDYGDQHPHHHQPEVDVDGGFEEDEEDDASSIATEQLSLGPPISPNASPGARGATYL